MEDLPALINSEGGKGPVRDRQGESVDAYALRCLQANKVSKPNLRNHLKLRSKACTGLKDRGSFALSGERTFSAARLKAHFVLDTGQNSICAYLPYRRPPAGGRAEIL